MYVNGYPCHIIHNTGNKGAISFALEAGFDIEDTLVDIFHWFDKINKRINTLEEFCEFMEQEYKKNNQVFIFSISLESAVTQCLKLYPSLKSYFLSVEEKDNQRFDKLFGKFKNPMTDVYMYFYQFSLQPFIRFNLYLQREDPLVSKLQAQIYRFLKNIACEFVKIRDVKNWRNISYLWIHHVKRKV